MAAGNEASSHLVLAHVHRLTATATPLALVDALQTRITSAQRLRSKKLLRRLQCASRRPTHRSGSVGSFRIRAVPVGLAGWVWLCHAGQPCSARLRALGKELVALGDEQHIAFARCIRHGARHLEGFKLKLPPTDRPTRGLNNLIFGIPIARRHGAKPLPRPRQVPLSAYHKTSI